MRRVLVYCCIFILLTFVGADYIYAHSGRTDSFGCHNCYTDYCYGEYHCHNGGYLPNYDYTPTYIQTPQAPNLYAKYTFTPNPDGRTFNVEFDWDDTPNTGYSIALNKYAGADPGPLTDTNVSKWIFYKVTPGIHYANLKVGIDYTWSTVTYWKIEVPKWYPPPIIAPTPISKPPVNSTSGTDWLPLAIFGIVAITIFWVIIYLLLKFVQWFIEYVKKHGLV